jgi:membrane protease YdiL (CAAX protease family)
VAAPPGTPFHQLARTPLHRWWRPLLGTVVGLLAVLLAAVGLYIVGLIIMVASGGDPFTAAEDGRLFENESLNLAFELLALALFIPAVLLAVFAVQRRPIGTVTSVLGRMRWRWLLVCAGLAAVACSMSLGVSLLTGVVTGEGDPWAGMSWSRMFPAVLVVVALVPFQAAAEEYVFRGWLPQAIGSCTLETATGRAGRAASRILRTPWPGIVVGAAAFTAGHAHRGWALLDIAMFGLVAGWLAVRTGGLEAPIALHVLNNLMAFSFAAAEGTLAEAAEVTDAPWYSLVSTVAQLSVFSALVLWLARRSGIENRRPADATGQVAAAEVPSLIPAQPGPSWAEPPTEPWSSHDGALQPPPGQVVPDRVAPDRVAPDQRPSGPDRPQAV